jgi:hypothetical protein
MAILEVDAPPSSPSDLMIITINQVWASNRFFQVYINDLNGDPANNDFMFMVTGR